MTEYPEWQKEARKQLLEHQAMQDKKQAAWLAKEKAEQEKQIEILKGLLQGDGLDLTTATVTSDRRRRLRLELGGYKFWFEEIMFGGGRQPTHKLCIWINPARQERINVFDGKPLSAYTLCETLD